jgi:hypothetical protein
MYRHVYVRSPAASRNLHGRISDLSKTREIDVWRWVRTFIADKYQSSDEIMTILTRTINLVRVNIQTPVTSQFLMTLRQCCPSLLSLKVWVDPESHETMIQVGLFEHITELGILTLRSASSRTQPMAPLTDVPSWNMPAVTHFGWYDQWSQWAHEATFISRCRFPHLTHLDIQLVGLYAVLEGMPYMCRLLIAHPNITSLRILVRDEHHLGIIPFVRARTLHVRCGRRCPLRELVLLLRPEVKTLELEFNDSIWRLHVHTLTSILRELFSQLAIDVERLSPLENIHLRSMGNHDLAPTTKEGFLDSLGSYILLLKARHIRVFASDCEISV